MQFGQERVGDSDACLLHICEDVEQWQLDFFVDLQLAVLFHFEVQQACEFVNNAADLGEVAQVFDGFGFAGHAEEGGFCLFFFGLEDELRVGVLGDPEVAFGEVFHAFGEELAGCGGNEAAHVGGQCGVFDGSGEFVTVGAQEFALVFEVHDDFAGCFVGEPGGEGGIEIRVDGASVDPEAGALAGEEHAEQFGVFFGGADLGFGDLDGGCVADGGACYGQIGDRVEGHGAFEAFGYGDGRALFVGAVVFFGCGGAEGAECCCVCVFGGCAGADGCVDGAGGCLLGGALLPCFCGGACRACGSGCAHDGAEGVGGTLADGAELYFVEEGVERVQVGGECGVFEGDVQVEVVDELVEAAVAHHVVDVFA